MTPKKFYLGKSGRTPGLALPADAVTRTFGIFGVKDSGKTTTARTLAEGIVKTGGYVVIFDPVGVWWGITRAGDGPGLPGIVIGGEHADVPLEETGGQLVAELCVARHYPVVVIDLKLLRKGAAQRFLADALEGIYFENRKPLHVMFEEADRALPQSPRGMDPTLGRVIGAAEDIVKLGRSRGLGSTFVSQRIATVTKNVVEQVQALVLHAQPGPLDRKTVKLWVEANGDPRATVKVMDTMASLDQGTAWFYSPAWLKALELVHVRMPQTLDSSSTPANDEREVEESAKRAPVNLEELRTRMADTVARAKENDPAELRKRIAALEEQLEGAHTEAPAPERILVPDRAAVDRLAELLASAETQAQELHDLGLDFESKVDAASKRLADLAGELQGTAELVSGSLDAAAALPREGAPKDVVRAGPHSRRRREEAERQIAASAEAKRRLREPATSNGDGSVSNGALGLVDTLSRVYPLWLDRGQLALLAGRGKRSSTLTYQLAEVVEAGMVETQRGRYRAQMPDGSHPPLPASELRERFRDALPAGPRAVFEALLRGCAEAARAHGDPVVNREWLFREAGFSPTSSTPVGHLKLLSDNGLAERTHGGGIALGPAVR